MNATESIRVLHVDDDPDFVETAAEFLGREDDRVEVSTATSAGEGLDRLVEEDFDCVVSDYDMPGRNGLEFFETVRERFPDLPFILFTGKGSEEIASEAITRGVTDYLRKQTGLEQYELLSKRVQNAVEQSRASRRAANLDRIRTLASNINRTLIRADSREEIEARVCEIISESDPYLFAWIGTVDPETDRIEPRAWAGIEEGYLDEITVTADESSTGRGPGGRAIRERRIAVSQNVRDDPEFDPWREEALERGYRAVAAVPVEYEGTLYAELTVYADRPYAFDDEERALLTELGDNIAHALHSIETRAELRKEHDRRRALFENAPEPVIAGDVQGDHRPITDVNEVFEDVFGLDAESIVGRDVAEVVVPEGARAEHERFRERSITGESVVTEVERVTADGPREFILYIIPYGAEDGRADGWYAWYTDIADRKERERELERYETMVNTAGDMVYILDTDGRFEFVNDTAETLTGYSRERLHGAHVDLVMEDRDIEAGRDLIENLLRDDGSEQASDAFSWTLHTAEGDTRPVESHITLLYENDEWAGTVGVVRDITERRERERELERQNERLEEFASIVSHDLRNPLTVADGRLELAQQECESEHLDALARAHERMEVLIGDLLTLARAGEAATDIEPIALPGTVDGCWRNVPTGEATLVVDTERTIRADRTRLQQLLENLMRNAVEHGGEDVTITVGDLPTGFYVADSGPGIPEEDREDVFESGYSTSEDGTGFGLAIVREIADAHGWEIGITESEDGGARFEITGVKSTRNPVSSVGESPDR